MIYQRHIPQAELIAAQLELLMQNGRIAMIGMQLVCVVGAVLMFWPFAAIDTILLWAAAFLLLLLARSLHMSNALVERRYESRPRLLYWQLIMGAAVTGAIWSALYIYATYHVPITMQYVFLVLIVMTSAFSLGFSVVIREYFIVYLFTSLLPIAWWSTVHYREQPYNLLIGLVLLAFCALMLYVSDKTYITFRNMISLTWEREHITQELGDLTGSLRDRNRQLRDARSQLTALANVDELTGLGNRRVVNSVLEKEINRARRAGADVSLILLDVDYFKNYNDTYGHPAGDVVLQKLADIMLQASTRAGEVVARYGGEEFILILPGASSESAMRTASRLKDMIFAANIPHENSAVADRISVSQGVVSVRPDGAQEANDLIVLADTALYSAKGSGRNAIAVG
ncbi:MAG: diguanylate cyclase (GGDEF)-like protein [Bacteroidia bacterium]|jgi:diguanylate cyclase (GGDEF)-like protein